MFRINDIKDSRRGRNKQTPPEENELYEERPNERTLPYFSVVPEQVMADERYRTLDSYFQGLLWLLVVHVLWKEGGRCIRHPGIIAKRLGIEETKWAELERILLDCGLLSLSPDEFFLIQRELRSQYLMTLVTNNNKRQIKKE